MPRKKTTATVASMVEPVQDRSRKTLDRIFKAVEQLLVQRRFEQISISEIARVAKCGVGTVYGRFENKAALLDWMERRLIESLTVRQARFLDQHQGKGIGFEKRARLLVNQLIEGYMKHAPVLRELVAKVHQSSNGPRSETRRQMSMLFEYDIEFLSEPFSGRDRKRAEKMLRLTLMTVITVLQNRLLQSQTSPIENDLSPAMLRKELPLMVTRYVLAELTPDEA